MNSPVGMLVGTAHRSALHPLRDASLVVYAPSLFEPAPIAWIRAESQRYALDESTEDAARFAICLAQFRFTRHARVVGLGG